LLLFTDEHRTPVCGRTAAKGLLLALEGVHGIIHLGGRERVSRYEFGVMLARTFGLDESLLRRARQGDIPMLAARPPDVSLDSSRAYGLGYDPPGILEALRRMRGKFKDPS
jgi:dTDP-4-dehydrorhamnose reductase